jgi:hypothetical protein
MTIRRKVIPLYVNVLMDVDDSVRLFNKTVPEAAALQRGARFGRMRFGPAGFREAPRPEDRKAPVCGRILREDDERCQCVNPFSRNLEFVNLFQP